MELGLKNNEVRLVDYDPKWAEEFKRIKEELINSTNLDESRIEHIGSTAIRNMSAKPIIDIVVGVDNLEAVAKELLKKFSEVGFLRLRVERPNEIILAKFKDDTYQEKTHFIHLVDYQKDLWNNLLFFRDYLNTHEEAREEYLDIKKSYTEHSDKGIAEYTNLKEKFVKDIFSKKS